MAAPKPVLSILPGGGYRVGFDGEPDLSGTGPDIQSALRALSAAISRRYDTEHGDETLEAQTARKQADILANDSYIRGHQLQQSVLLALACGFI
jgi:hypothetical protein